jgi:ribonuclease HI
MSRKNYPTSKTAIVYTDGASSGNPGPAGIGAVIVMDDRKTTLSEYIGVTTNNVAEYTALIRALEMALKMGAKRIKVMLDSELVVKQLHGIYRVRNERLLTLYKKTLTLLQKFSTHEIQHIPREENTEADRLSKEGIRMAKSEAPQLKVGGFQC